MGPLLSSLNCALTSLGVSFLQGVRTAKGCDHSCRRMQRFSSSPETSRELDKAAGVACSLVQRVSVVPSGGTCGGTHCQGYTPHRNDTSILGGLTKLRVQPAGTQTHTSWVVRRCQCQSIPSGFLLPIGHACGHICAANEQTLPRERKVCADVAWKATTHPSLDCSRTDIATGSGSLLRWAWCNKPCRSTC